MTVQPVCEHCGGDVEGHEPPDVLVAHIGRDYWVCSPCWTRSSGCAPEQVL